MSRMSYREGFDCPLTIPTLYRLRLAGRIPSAWRSPHPESRSSEIHNWHTGEFLSPHTSRFWLLRLWGFHNKPIVNTVLTNSTCSSSRGGCRVTVTAAAQKLELDSRGVMTVATRGAAQREGCALFIMRPQFHCCVVVISSRARAKSGTTMHGFCGIHNPGVTSLFTLRRCYNDGATSRVPRAKLATLYRTKEQMSNCRHTWGFGQGTASGSVGRMFYYEVWKGFGESPGWDGCSLAVTHCVMIYSVHNDVLTAVSKKIPTKNLNLMF